MGLFIGILAVLLVLFLILTMAVGEWTDKDWGELLRTWFGKRPSPSGPTDTTKVEKEVIAVEAPGPALEKKTKPVPVKKQAAKKAVRKAVVKKTRPKASSSNTKSQKGKTK